MTKKATAAILRIELQGFDNSNRQHEPKAIPLDEPTTRQVNIYLNTGEKVSVWGGYGGYVQGGAGGNNGPESVYAITQHIAQRYSKWLNGGKCPAALKKYPTTEIHTLEEGQEISVETPAPAALIDHMRAIVKFYNEFRAQFPDFPAPQPGPLILVSVGIECRHCIAYALTHTSQEYDEDRHIWYTAHHTGPLNQFRRRFTTSTLDKAQQLADDCGQY
ncbi:hypothetical protein [Hymenobacter metallicola]|uniref:Uncharacterized protein n=1 Tax=Hymenobacter metallicola TaxID=2563114 RepID=A0A4Z0QM71_9BACT|nr:hypothetical protein [Hymenobacter metallicola]TGE29842.1 hypothetical protein E5K02_10385 [Hymenobacter metallicola]